MIVDGLLEPMEVAHLPYKKGYTFEDYLGVRGLQRLGKKKWRRHVAVVVEQLKAALGSRLRRTRRRKRQAAKGAPPGARLGDNSTAFIGGFRLWRSPARGRSGKKSEWKPEEIASAETHKSTWKSFLDSRC